MDDVEGLKKDLYDYFTELFGLIPKVLRFVWLLLAGAVTVFLAPVFGSFLLAAYLWSERDWSNKLSLKQKFVFWSIALPLSIANYICGVLFLSTLML